MGYRIQNMREATARQRQEARYLELPTSVETHIELLSDAAALWVIGEELRPEDGDKFVSVRDQLREKVRKVVLETRA